MKKVELKCIHEYLTNAESDTDYKAFGDESTIFTDLTTNEQDWMRLEATLNLHSAQF
jgi:hypothetical protein